MEGKLRNLLAWYPVFVKKKRSGNESGSEDMAMKKVL